LRPAATSNERSPAELVVQPATVMRIGSMVTQLLEEVRAGPLDGRSCSGGSRGCSTGSRPTLFAQQMASKLQLEQMRGGQPALPGSPAPGGDLPHQGSGTGQCR